MFQQLPTSGVQKAAPNPPSIGGDAAERKLGPVALNIRFENPAQKIVLEVVKMRHLLPT
jgi:hypothetical protein